jgi:Protein of unknown function (DUF1501)
MPRSHEFIPDPLSRRAFLARTGLSFGALACADLFARESAPLPKSTGAPTRARAKSVIYVHLAGGPPQVDWLDCKPTLQRLHGTKCPKEFIEGKRLAFTKGHPNLLGSPHSFTRLGKAGAYVTDQVPHFRNIVDDVTIVRSMTTDQFNHAPAELLMFTGSQVFGGASMGSWVTWGLGSPNRDLPGFMVMISGDSDPTGGKALWSSSYLPSNYQGVQLRGRGDPVLYVSDPKGMTRDVRRRSLDALSQLNSIEHERSRDPETLARIEQYELAFRMQTAVPGVMDIASEPESVRAEYGAVPSKGSFANNCLLARRLVESGVRFVQLFDWGWDVHGTGPGDDLVSMYPAKCRDVDRPLAALVSDLKRRGLLDETLVVCGGEFGRTSFVEGRDGSTYAGRDHHPGCFSMWFAGAGIHRGHVIGATDELGYTVVENPVTPRDLQATILYLLGLDPFRLRFPSQGLEQRLIGPTDEARVHHELFA